MRENKFRTQILQKERATIDFMHFELCDIGNVFKDDGVFYIDGIPCDLNKIDEYTGLKDKNDKEIYEADIVKQSLWGIAVIKFGEGTNLGGGDSSAYFYGYYLEYINQKDDWGNNEVDSGSLRDTSEIEIIGNIYENKELLKGN